MTTLFCWMIGGLFAISIYLLLSQQLMRWLFGIVILGSTTNFVILLVGHLAQTPPFVLSGKAATMANPLSQALILTAIVIGFGLFSFALVLVRKVWENFKTLDSDKLRLAEPLSQYEKTP